MMKLYTILLLLITFNVSSQNVKILSPNDNTADFKVKIVNNNMKADIWVMMVKSKSETKGEMCYWRAVDKKEDFSISRVDEGEDFSVWYTDDEKLPIIRSEYVKQLIYDKLKNGKK